MITQIIWFLSLPVMIFISYKLVALTVSYMEKKQK
jgi:hypothetical protein